MEVGNTVYVLNPLVRTGKWEKGMLPIRSKKIRAFGGYTGQPTKWALMTDNTRFKEDECYLSLEEAKEAVEVCIDEHQAEIKEKQQQLILLGEEARKTEDLVPDSPECRDW